MLAKYVWLTTSTQAQMLNDLCLLFTGSPVSALSASCDKVNSQVIANTLPNNWTVYDAAAGASAQVLRSLNTDGVSYKYMHLSFSGNNLIVTTYESWNATTHVGTNQACRYTNAAYTITATAAFTATAGGTLYLYATNEIAMFGSTSQVPAGVAEFTRNSPAIDETYPCHTLGFMSTCRVKNALAAGDFKFGSTPAFTSGTQTYSASTSDRTLRMPSGTIAYQAIPLYLFAAMGSGSAIMCLGEVLGIKYFGFCPTGNYLDEVVIDGETYVYFLTASATNIQNAWIVKKG